MSNDQQIIDSNINKEYEYGFVTDIESETIPPGLNEEVIRLISHKKDEPEWLLEWRLKAYRHWKKDENPKLGKDQLSRYRLPVHKLLLCAKEKRTVKLR